MLDRFHIPPELFTPFPEGLLDPDEELLHRYHSVDQMGVKFHCMDDGGLLADPDPVGKTFRLRNDLGLEAVLTIKEDRRNENRNGMDFDERIYVTPQGFYCLKAEFLAEGYLEGYTAKERSCNPAFLIRTDGYKVDWLAWYENADDRRARQAFPLWQEFHAAAQKAWVRDEKMIRKLCDDYLHQEDE